MKIRRAQQSDAAAIMNLNQELFNDNQKYDNTLDMSWPGKNKEYYKKSINDKNSIALVAEEEKKVIGYLIGSISEVENYRKIKKTAEIDNMLILKEFQGQGIGSNLIKEFMDWARSKKVEVVKVSVYSDNIGAIAAYSKNGFSDYSRTMEIKI